MYLGSWKEPIQITVSPTQHLSPPTLDITKHYREHTYYKDWYVDEYGNEVAIRYRHCIDGEVHEEYIEPIRTVR